MHSGIGEEKQLKEFDIPVIENLKGVGKNLQDHHELPVISRVKPGYSYFKQDQGWRMIKNGIEYLLFNFVCKFDIFSTCQIGLKSCAYSCK